MHAAFKTESNASELAMIASSTALMQACKRGVPSDAGQPPNKPLTGLQVAQRTMVWVAPQSSAALIKS